MDLFLSLRVGSSGQPAPPGQPAQNIQPAQFQPAQSQPAQITQPTQHLLTFPRTTTNPPAPVPNPAFSFAPTPSQLQPFSFSTQPQAQPSFQPPFQTQLQTQLPAQPQPSGSEPLYMSIHTVFATPSKSFEEVRIDDYLKAYRTTGRPPLPCPVEPTIDSERAALGLPPTFTPWKDPSPSAPTLKRPGIVTPDSAIKCQPSELPDSQVFFPIKSFDESTGNVTYESISCMPRFGWYSFEELRYYAYRNGHKHPPRLVPTPPLPEEPTNSTVLFGLNRQPNVVITPTPLNPSETYVHISTKPEYAKHSAEELRLAYIVAGRQLTSDEIMKVTDAKKSRS
ncbi:hypothetical protein AMATHDRAFT_87909 [Amanita thiersii Skay4041]|uniref:Uncharacterized protein n=1 Tax=Amanita thiersii Skay4041 TaxID=703135 RepID=A0A2A9NFR5_9AGAR|nr:hypothetical protein AMATHDRAFT_87909 [Amanita thiersii Skay4041]